MLTKQTLNLYLPLLLTLVSISTVAQERTDVRSDLVITAEGKVVQNAPSSPATSLRTFTPSAPVARLNVPSRHRIEGERAPREVRPVLVPCSGRSSPVITGR